MSMDVRFGMIYGVKVWDILLEDRLIEEEKFVITYDKYSGKPNGQERIVSTKYKLLVTIPKLGEIGELISETEFIEWMYSFKIMLNNEYGDGLFIYDYNGCKFFGMKAFGGEEPYEYPQDMAFDFVDETEKAKLLWDKYFPYLSELGGRLLYMRVSA